MFRKLIPKQSQWKSWTLPSKHTAIGCALGLVAVILSVIFWIFPRQAPSGTPGLSAVLLHLAEPKAEDYHQKQDFPFIRNNGEMVKSFEDGTFYLWFKLRQQMGMQERYLVSYINYYNGSFMEIMLTSDESLEFRIHDARNKKHVLRYTHHTKFTEWTNVAVTWESNVGVNLYVNGVEKSHASTPSANFGVLINEWYFGSHPQATVPLGGQIAELLLYERAIPERELLDMYSVIAKSKGILERKNVAFEASDTNKTHPTM